MRYDEAEASSTVKSADRTLDLFELLLDGGAKCRTLRSPKPSIFQRAV